MTARASEEFAPTDAIRGANPFIGLTPRQVAAAGGRFVGRRLVIRRWWRLSWQTRQHKESDGSTERTVEYHEHAGQAHVTAALTRLRLHLCDGTVEASEQRSPSRREAVFERAALGSSAPSRQRRDVDR
jgi:hypothetical protein